MTPIYNILSFQSHDVEKLSIGSPFLFNIEIILIFILLFYIQKKSPPQILFSVDLSNTIKGIAILLIIVHHLCRHALNNANDLYLYYHVGTIGVSLFLFLSGYGLNESFLKKGLNSFFKKKLLNIYIPFTLINILLITLNISLLGQEYNYTKTAKVVTGVILEDRNFWYMGILFFWYTLFFLLSRTSALNKYRLLLLTISGFCIVLSSGFPDNIKSSSLAFPFGVIASEYKTTIINTIRSLNTSRKIALLLFPFLLITILKLQSLYDLESFYKFTLILVPATIFILFKLPVSEFVGLTVVTLIGGLFCFRAENVSMVATYIAEGFVPFSLTIALKRLAGENCSIIFNFVGKYSLEIFLLHGSFMYSYDFILYKLPLEISFLIYLAFILTISVFMRKISSVVTSIIIN